MRHDLIHRAVIEALEGRVAANSPLGPGLALASFNAMDLSASPFSTTSANQINFSQSSLADSTGQQQTAYHVRYTGTLNVSSSDLNGSDNTFYFQVPAADGAILLIDNHPVIYSASLIGDINLDGVVDHNDLIALFQQGFYQTGTPGAVWTDGDLTGEGLVNVNDLNTLLSYHYEDGSTVYARQLDNTTNDPNVAANGYDGNLFTDVGLHLSAGSHTFQYDYIHINNDQVTSAEMLWSTPAQRDFHSISYAKPVVRAQPINATAGAPTAIAGTFEPATLGSSPTDYTTTMNWGDGTQSSNASPSGGLALSVNMDGSFAVFGTHNYAYSSSPSAATLTVTHRASGLTGSSDVPVQISEPTGVTISPGNVDASRGQPSTGNIVATFSELDPTAPLTSFTTNIDWGDQTATVGIVAGAMGEFAISGDHTYESAGEYTVTASVYDAAGNSDSTSFQTLVSETSPDVPTNLTATKVDDGEIALQWNATDFATGYSIYRAADHGIPNQIGTVGEGITSYTDNNGGAGLAGHTDYTYTVRATNDAGESLDSNSAGASIDDHAPIPMNVDQDFKGPIFVLHDSAASVTLYGSDPDGDEFHYASASAEQGTCQINEDGTIRYTAKKDYVGPDKITYTLSDGTLTSTDGTIDIQVYNEPPTLQSIGQIIPYTVTTTTTADGDMYIYSAQPVTGTVAGYDVTNDSLTYSVVSGPTAGGSFHFIGNTSNYIYTPTADAAGGAPTDTVVIKVNDGVNDSNLATLTFVGFTVGTEADENEDGDTVADGDEATMNSGSPDAASFNAGVVLQGQSIHGTLGAETGSTFHLVSEDPGNPSASGHVVTLNPNDGTFTYQAPESTDSQMPENDWFTYYFTDSKGNKSNYATVFITIQPVSAALVWSDQPANSDSSYRETLNVNDDIDNADGIPDNQETTLVARDADLRTLNLVVETGLAPLPIGSTITLSGGSGSVRVWEPDGNGGYNRIMQSGSKTWTVDSSTTAPYDLSVIVEGTQTASRRCLIRLL